jgi:methionyl-tRNA synthetase
MHTACTSLRQLMYAAICRAQTQICQSIFNSIHTNGHTATRTNEQLYSTALDKFLADRYVVGTCPKCAYDDARGDQCDNCGSLLNPTELKDPRYAACSSSVAFSPCLLFLP